MAAYSIIRVEKLKYWGAVAGAVSHNARQRETPNAAPTALVKNRFLIGSPDDDPVAVCKARLGNQKVRKNAVYGVDGFLGASPEYFRPDAPDQISALNGHFGFVDYDFTRSLEKRLDNIADGQTDYLTVVSATFGLLEKVLKSFGHACPECAKPLRHLVNQGENPRKSYDYWACTNRPDCPASFVNDDGKPGVRREKKPALLSEFKCPKCGKPLAYRRGTGKSNKPYEFFSCSGYPDCTEKFSPEDGQPDF